MNPLLNQSRRYFARILPAIQHGLDFRGVSCGVDIVINRKRKHTAKHAMHAMHTPVNPRVDRQRVDVGGHGIQKIRPQPRLLFFVKIKTVAQIVARGWQDKEVHDEWPRNSRFASSHFM